VVDLAEEVERDGGGPPAAADEEELLFGADPPHALLDHPAVEHPLERPEVVEKMFEERAEPLALERAGDVLFAHMPSLSRGFALRGGGTQFPCAGLWGEKRTKCVLERGKFRRGAKKSAANRRVH